LLRIERHRPGASERGELCSRDRMNVFTTDHPLASDLPRSNALASFLVVALMLCPFLLGLLWLTNLTGNQDTTDYTPDPFWEVLVGAIVDSLVLALVALALYRLGSCTFRKICSGLKQKPGASESSY
jgi:hypothetical protein